MLHKSISAFCLIAAIVIAAAGSIWAAVPSGEFQIARDSALEVVNITALSIDQNSETHPYGDGVSVTTTRVMLTARVDVVHRTVSGLLPGSVIVVRYLRSFRTPPVPGIQQDIVLNIGERAAAYLKQTEAAYLKLTDEKSYMLACPFGCLKKL
jgi:hypothetical protein